MPYLPIVGPTYYATHASINAQRCVNFFFMTSGSNPSAPSAPGSASPLGVLHYTAGSKALLTTDKDSVRGVTQDDDYIYAVIGDTLYECELDTTTLQITATDRGTLNTSTGEVSMAQAFDWVMIADGTNGYTYEKSTNTFAEITDGDYPDTATTVVYVGSFFFVFDPDTDDVYASGVLDPTSWGALDFTSIEALPDNVVSLGVLHGYLWAFGSSSVEVYGLPVNLTNFPLTKVTGIDSNHGCGAAKSVLSLKDHIYWLSDRDTILRASGSEIEEISTQPIAEAIQEYSTTSDAIAYSYRDKGFDFYALSFPTADTTWCYNTTSGHWHELNSTFDYYVEEEGRTLENYQRRHLLDKTVYHKGHVIGGGWTSGNLYKMSGKYYTDETTPIIRQRTSPHFFNLDKPTFVAYLQLFAEVGVGTNTGQGVNPQIQLEVSKDRGHSWGPGMYRSLGKQGEYDAELKWGPLGSSRTWTFRLTVSDPVPVILLESMWMGR